MSGYGRYWDLCTHAQYENCAGCTHLSDVGENRACVKCIHNPDLVCNFHKKELPSKEEFNPMNTTGFGGLIQ